MINSGATMRRWPFSKSSPFIRSFSNAMSSAPIGKIFLVHRGNRTQRLPLPGFHVIPHVIISHQENVAIWLLAMHAQSGAKVADDSVAGRHDGVDGIWAMQGARPDSLPSGATEA